MKHSIIIILILALLLLSACAAGSKKFDDPVKPANFFHGIWHGWIAPIALIWQLFNPSIRIYEANNMGWSYDFGFYIAIIGGFGGLTLSRRRKAK